MKTTKTELKPYRVRAYCECGNELRTPTSGGILGTLPLIYKVWCNVCGEATPDNQEFPRIEYEEVIKEK